MSVTVVDHPLLRHKLGLLRRRDLSCSQFRAVAGEMACLLLYEATRDLQLEPASVDGWAGEVPVGRLHESSITLVPILRAGLGLLDGVMRLLPEATVSVVGLYRNEDTLKPVQYFAKLAPQAVQAIVLDPMLATGGSLVACVDILRQAGCPRICSINLVCAPEGIDAMQAAHPDVAIYTAAIDERLDDRGYIRPGLGDAGDRIFGTI